MRRRIGYPSILFPFFSLSSALHIILRDDEKFGGEVRISTFSGFLCYNPMAVNYTLMEGTNVIPPRRRPQNLYHRKNEFNFDEKSRQSSSIGRTRAVRVFVAKCRVLPRSLTPLLSGDQFSNFSSLN